MYSYPFILSVRSNRDQVPSFLLPSYPGAKILEFTDEGMQETTLEETSYHQIIKRFFDD
ncbi:hypothetical protein [Sporosarcina ureae]|uniref:hypothetical protein n=1 Tax=Sporosarcina ureae TaxID=1571 RepID=UPI001AD83D93|nr:hypothetical protein [Sporosarcina ureae]